MRRQLAARVGVRRGHPRARDSQEQDKWYAIVEERLAAYDKTAGSAEERRTLTGLRSVYQRYRQARPKFFELWQAGEKDNAGAWIALAIMPFGAQTARAFEAQISLQRSFVDQARARSERQVSLALALVTAITIALLGMLVIGYTYSIRMLRPIRALREQAQRVVREQLGEAIEVSTSNEVAALVDSFELMSDRLRAHAESLRQSNEQLNFLLRAKSDFLNNVTHELRTPLNSVIGFAELLKDEVPGPLNAKQAAFATDILASGQRLLALVEGILEIGAAPHARCAARQRDQVQPRGRHGRGERAAGRRLA